MKFDSFASLISPASISFVNRAEAVRVLRRVVESGINFHRCADSYGPGEVGPNWMIMWPFDPKATGLPTTHRPTGPYIM
jgi:hypothetical protein